MLENASPLEAGRTITALFGMAPSAVLLYRAVGAELRRHKAGVNGALEAAMHKDIAVGAVFLVVSVCFFTTGLIAMQAPPSPLAAVDPSAALPPIVSAVLFIVAHITVTLGAGYCLLRQEAIDQEVRAAGRRDRRRDDARGDG